MFCCGVSFAFSQAAKRRRAERRDIDGVRGDRLLRRTGEETLVGRLQLEVSRLPLLLDELQILAHIGRQERKPEANADAHLVLRRGRRRGHA
jgi:hypothetical protein